MNTIDYSDLSDVENLTASEYAQWNTEVGSEDKLTTKFIAMKVDKQEYNFLQEVATIYANSFGFSSDEVKNFRTKTQKASVLLGLDDKYTYKKTATGHKDSDGNKTYYAAITRVKPHSPAAKKSGTAIVHDYLIKGQRDGKFTWNDISLAFDDLRASGLL